ncbi:hypothetical protein BsWGS_23062 [Bradybaena similaris]
MEPVRLNCLLMGKTGQGKSLTGNSLLGRRAFKVSSDAESITKDVQQDYAEFGNYILKIVDGPGLQDTAMNSAKDKETAATNMTQALAMCDGGVDAFLFVYRYGIRMTDEERRALEALKQIFGAKYFSNLIVILTMGDLFRDNMEDEGKGNISFHDWCREQTGALRQLFDDCRERFILFNNRERNENAMNQQRKEVIELVNQVQRINGRYTSKTFKEAKALRDRYVIEQKVPILNDKIQEKCGLLMADLEKYMKTQNAQDKFKITESISAIKKDITDQDKGTNSLQHLLVHVERIEEHLGDIDQLNKLTKELDDTRKSKSFWTKLGSFVSGVGGVVSGVGGVSLWTTLLTFTMPPVALAVAAGTTVVAGAATGIKRYCSSSKETRIEEEQNQIKAKLEKARLTGNQAK